MKKTFLGYAAACSLVAVFSACKKDNTPTPNPTAFVQQIGDGGGVDVRVITNNSGNKEYLVLGYVYNGNYRDFRLVKTDTSGTVTGTYTFGNDTDDQLDSYHTAQAQAGAQYDYDEVPARLLPLADGSGYILAGTRQRIEVGSGGNPDVAKEKRIVLYQLDNQFSLEQVLVLRYEEIGNNTHDVNNMCSDELADIRQMIDIDGVTSLGFVLTGNSTKVDTLKPDYVDNQSADRCDIFTARLNTDLTFNWHRTYGFIGEDKGAAVEILNGGDFMVTGSCQQREPGTPTQMYNTFLAVKYKPSSGNISNQNHFGTKSSEIIAGYSCYDATNDILTAIGTDENTGQLVTLQINSDMQNPANTANPVEISFISLQAVASSAVAKSIALSPNGGFIASATTQSSVGLALGNNIHILKLNANGGATNQAYFGNTGNDAAGFVVPDVVNGAVHKFVFTGMYASATQQNTVVGKLNPDLSL